MFYTLIKQIFDQSERALGPIYIKKKKYIYIYIYLTIRFHVAVRLFSNRSQMTSKCGNDKKVAHERCRHLCVCPLIVHRREPISMRE